MLSAALAQAKDLFIFVFFFNTNHIFDFHYDAVFFFSWEGGIGLSRSYKLFL